ncbi:hypothetical protein D3P07_08745 [Paenibacillus sp. 1011MAR3C5]|uniref:hypothetical protein n=1 Tax=Paenibacillus sp. 1011MAR3C5 TaxID=1675787 RepID=UPI000E6CAEE6|nr:hypothetical protein [Paenibacillus sp. 1011MAR3C5]RJE90282.1 hypothetical protein D3P07_08745 [Paenibacillus sp. 1011MAR3C5]
MEAVQRYAIKRPFGNYAVIPYGLMMIGLLVVLIIRSNLSQSVIPIIMTSIPFSIFATWFIIIVVQLIKYKPNHLQFVENAIVLYNREIQPADIEEIIVQGNFNPSIGIVPRGKRFVPTYLCFAFREHDDGIQALKEWANLHQVEVKAGSYRTWI